MNEKEKAIKFLDLRAVTQLHGAEISEAVQRVVDSGWYLLGEETARFESDYAHFIGTRHCIGCGNGLDALTLIYRAYIEMGLMQPGDEVLVPANTYIASILAITENGLRPVLVDPQPDSLEMDAERLEQLITPRTRSILIVHLYGRCTFTEPIARFCDKYGLKLVEDNAQAHGCRYVAPSEAVSQHSLCASQQKRTGSLGHAAGHSFYPGKNLGALGDGGAVTTDDDQLAAVVRSLANYGSQRKYVFDYCGRNSRLDEVQAAVLSVKLRYLDADNEQRRQIADYYCQHINSSIVRRPTDLPREANVWHLFPIFCPERDALQNYLAEHGVQTLIHYPIPPHRQQCYKQWKTLSLPVSEQLAREELSLPISPAMPLAEAERVATLINQYRGL